MRLFLLIVVILVTVVDSFAQPLASKTKLEEILREISDKPSVFISDNHLYIIHPMIKKEDRERQYKVEGNLHWQGDSCTITYTSYEQTKGPKSKSTIKMGETFSFVYPLQTLQLFLLQNEFYGWKFTNDLTLDKQQFSGYKSTVFVDGKEKNFEVYLKDNELYAASCGFANAGISHEDGAEESADFWYFGKEGGALRLLKKFTIEASKQNSVPILNKTTATYQY